MKSDVFPAAIPSIMVNFRDSNVQWISNSPTSLQGLTKANEWQEVTTQIRVPDNTMYAQIQFFVVNSILSMPVVFGLIISILAREQVFRIHRLKRSHF
jgi:hypothetical protein